MHVADVYNVYAMYIERDKFTLHDAGIARISLLVDAIIVVVGNARGTTRPHR